jgi:hypothetical protein
MVYGYASGVGTLVVNRDLTAKAYDLGRELAAGN